MTAANADGRGGDPPAIGLSTSSAARGEARDGASRPSLLHALEHGVGHLAALLRLELLRALVEAEAVLPGAPVHVVDAQGGLALQLALGRDRPVGRLRLLR